MKKILAKNFLLLIILFYILPAQAQLIDNTETFRNIDSKSYLRFHYDNDVFNGTDQYYTEGVSIEYVNPGLKRFFLSKLLWKPYNTEPKYGLTLNLFAYTPTSISSDDILYGDRPFDAVISAETFLIQADPVHHQQLSSSFSLGLTGPAALGYEIQKSVHKLFDYLPPLGWEYQIRNDILLNYKLNYEKQLLAAGNNFLLNGTAQARAGTLNDKLSAGFNFMAGSFTKPFSPVSDNKRKAAYYFYGQSRLNVIGYDASLQGGLFNRRSPYIIAAADITRFTYQADAGIIINFKTLYFAYTQSYLTKEFRTGKYHRWGGISVGFAL